MLEFGTVPDFTKAMLQNVPEVPVFPVDETTRRDTPIPVDIGCLPEEEAFCIAEGFTAPEIVEKNARPIPDLFQGIEEGFRSNDPAVDQFFGVLACERLVCRSPQTSLLEAELYAEGFGQSADVRHFMEVEFEDEKLEGDMWERSSLAFLHLL